MSKKCKSKSGICTPTLVCVDNAKNSKDSKAGKGDCHCLVATACLKAKKDASKAGDEKKLEVTDLDDRMDLLESVGKGRMKKRLQGVIGNLRSNQAVRKKLIGN